jgi:hypothetical protein
MKEYIDREALIAEYDRVHQGPAGGARKLMVDAPAADVVEVVRCINCVYWDGRGYDGRCEAPENGLIRDYTNYDDYCSYGERKKPNE